MRKIIFSLAIIALFGAGCAGESPMNGNAPENSNSGANANANANVNSGGLEPLPATNAPSAGIDDSAWRKYSTKSGIAFSYPDKPTYAPTEWSYYVLSATDPNLKGSCYVTSEVKYEVSPFPPFDDACQTTTDYGAGPGTRTDYFVFKKDNRLNFFVLTKKYAAGFDMDQYAANVEHMLKIIK